MDVSVFERAAISFPVQHIEWHRVWVSVEDRWLIHIIPEIVKVVRSFEVFIAELLSPVVLRIFIQKVDVSRSAWPAVTIECFHFAPTIRFWSPNEDVGQIFGVWLLVLQLHTVFVDIVLRWGLDMRINNHCDAPVSGFNFIVHLFDLSTGEVLGVKDEVLIALRITVLVSPFDIHP